MHSLDKDDMSDSVPYPGRYCSWELNNYILMTYRRIMWNEEVK